MKKRFISFLSGMVVGAVMFGGSVAYASGILADLSNNQIFVDGTLTPMEAYVINGHNYVKLRDIGQAVGFNVFWDDTAKCVQVESDNPYTGIAPTKQEGEKSSDQPYQTDVDAIKKDIVTRTNTLRLNKGVAVLEVNNRMRFDMCNLHSLPEYVPQDSLNELMQDGITIVRSRALPAQYIVDINKHISNRINNCKSLFPLWLKWEYVRKLFLMPDGLNEKGIKAAAADYYANKNKYPYQVYINWSYMDSGNILYNDKKFVSLLYEANEDYFTDLNKVSDAGNLTKAGIYKFLDKSERVVVVVDCENSDPYKLYATLNNLNQEALLNKICKIILYDDIHTTSAWKILERFTQIPIEHVLIERIKENKSLVDIRLTTGTCREYYQNNVDSFILVSSDSDYWGLISAMPEVRFFVMVESEKCSPTIKNALINAGISYCYIDDFCTGNSNDIKVAAVLREVRQKLDQAFHLNVRDILDEACRATRADMTTAEKNQFYDKYIKTMHVDISPNGEAMIVLGK